jgi:hypothetical protein
MALNLISLFSTLVHLIRNNDTGNRNRYRESAVRKASPAEQRSAFISKSGHDCSALALSFGRV